VSQLEVPVLLDAEDINHYKHQLNFDIPFSLKDEEYLTGHIDLIQIRNGSIYIMDFKPSAEKTKPIEQLTIYALALSRLTGIRLYHFKCAWFDDKNYYEFFPLHVVYKINKKKDLIRIKPDLLLGMKMKIKEVQAGVKLTKNYDSYQASLTADLEIGESPEKVGEELMEKALEIVRKKVKPDDELNDEKSSEIEVGAAWQHKKYNDLLSVKNV